MVCLALTILPPVPLLNNVFDQLNVNYALSGMRDLLHREGYAYKKPKLVLENVGP